MLKFPVGEPRGPFVFLADCIHNEDERAVFEDQRPHTITWRRGTRIWPTMI